MMRDLSTAVFFFLLCGPLKILKIRMSFGYRLLDIFYGAIDLLTSDDQDV